MKQIASKLFFAVLIFCLPGLSLGQTSLSGTISSDSTLTLAGSPYTLTEAFGVSAGYELTIEPGVSINGNFEVTIEGTLVMEGTATDSIFVDNTRFKFTKTNLDSSSIQYISFKGLSGVMIGNRLSSAGNNTGQLHLSKSTFYSNSRVEAWGYLSNASSILISESKFYDARVEGDLQEGEIIYLEDCDLYDSFVSSEDYHSGIFLRNSRIEESSFFSDCCGANINFDLCTITSSIMGTGDVNIDSSLLYETNFSRRGGTLQLTNSRLEGLGTLEQRDYLFAKPALVIDNCIIDAKGNDYGMIELYGGGTLFEVKNSTFIGFTDVIYSVKRLPHTITNNNFIDFEGYAIEHRGNNDLDARGNYWDYDSTVLSEIFFDKLDDLAYGLVDYSEYLDEPTDQLPALPPTEVCKGLQGGEVLLSWTAVSNSQLGGYRVYEQSGEDLELLGEVDAQTTQFTKEGISLSGEYVVVSYKTGADGEDDFREGNVSSESEPAEVYFTESDISAQYCEGDSVAFSVLSTTLDASETYQVQISQSEDFASPINLGTLDSATLTMTVALPDTLMADASYQLRVLAETADVYVSSQELVYRTFPSASFTALDSICYQDTLTVTYAEAADANATYAWDFDLGVIQSGSDSGPIEVAWSDAGEKNIHLSVNRYGCIAESDEKVYITEELVSDFTTTALVCEGNTADVTVSSPPVSESVFTWDWDGATNTSSTTAPSLVWDTFGEKTISLSISQNGCSSETSVQIVSYQATPTPSISLPANQACNGEEMELTYDGDQLENLSLTWEIMGAEEVSTTGDTIITIKWTAEGPQTVEVMADLAGCLASATDTVTVNPIPSSSFSAPTEVCEGSSAAIAYLGNAGENANFVWVWDGADTVTEGTTAYALTWSTLGDKEVSLVVTEEGCTSDTTRKAIAHTANPTLLFSAAASACR
ncbi:MAG TPA: hypothetical protein DCP28_26875, partial [Cytophagales bacterium]|nr:hypothetical protein [Cytophagales bacterium]